MVCVVVVERKIGMVHQERDLHAKLLQLSLEYYKVEKGVKLYICCIFFKKRKSYPTLAWEVQRT